MSAAQQEIDDQAGNASSMSSSEVYNIGKKYAQERDGFYLEFSPVELRIFADELTALGCRRFGASTGGTQAAGAEYLSKRLARVAKLAGVRMPEHFTHEQIAEVAPTILGEIARNLERTAALQTELVSALRQARDALLDHGDERVVAPAVDRVEGVLAKVGAM